jgi:hypothetical protein
VQGYVVAECDLVRDADGTVTPFLLPMSFESGVEDGEAWSEGSRSAEQVLSAQPAGTYSLKLEVEREKAEVTGPLTVRVEQGVSRFRNWVLVLLALLAVPVGVGVFHLMFEVKRWQNSDYSPFQSG